MGKNNQKVQSQIKLKEEFKKEKKIITISMLRTLETIVYECDKLALENHARDKYKQALNFLLTKNKALSKVDIKKCDFKPSKNINLKLMKEMFQHELAMANLTASLEITEIAYYKLGKLDLALDACRSVSTYHCHCPGETDPKRDKKLSAIANFHYSFMHYEKKKYDTAETHVVQCIRKCEDILSFKQFDLNVRFYNKTENIYDIWSKGLRLFTAIREAKFRKKEASTLKRRKNRMQININLVRMIARQAFHEPYCYCC